MEYTPRFITDLEFKDPGGFPFTLTAPLTYVSNIKLSDGLAIATFTVPTGSPTDLASIPQFLWTVLPPIGKYDWAAVLHDFLYKHGRVNGRTVTRAQADSVLLEAMQVTPPGVTSFVKRATIYAGVRAGGWKAWDKYRAA